MTCRALLPGRALALALFSCTLFCSSLVACSGGEQTGSQNTAAGGDADATAGAGSGAGASAGGSGGSGTGGGAGSGGAISQSGAGNGGGAGGTTPLPPSTCRYNALQAAPGAALPAPGGPTSAAEPGLIDGITSWTPPTTPNGLTPQQSWYSVGSTPAGDLYFSTADHVTNSALYRIDLATDTCAYAGDARAASEAANNWQAGESAQKFHIRPTYHQGRVYVATTDFSDPNAGYLQHRGFHWYGFDEAQGSFLDLSASEPGGVAANNFQCMAMTLDRPRGILYCLGTPNGNLYEYTIADGTTRDLGRPSEVSDEYLFVGRFTWTDAEGRVYFTYMGYDKVFAYDPVLGFRQTDWDLGGLELKFGQWSLDRQRCYLGDYEGRLYLFDDAADTFLLIGQATVPSEYNSTEDLYLWQTRLFQISADERKFYYINDSSTGAYALFEYDIAEQTSAKIAELNQLDAALPGPYLFHSGYDSWDTRGRFAYVNFNMIASDTLRVTRIDPVRVKVAQGVLPELITVQLQLADGAVQLTRSGSSDTDLSVILALYPEGASEAPSIQSVTLPAGSASLDVGGLLQQAGQLASGSQLRVVAVPDGNRYVTGESSELRLDTQCD